MIPLATAEQTRSLDRYAAEVLGLSGSVLMEVASLRVAEAVRERLCAKGRVAVVTGPGNNGGDGWGAARWLHSWGIDVWVWPAQDPTSGDAVGHRRAALAAGVVQAAHVDADVIVDALFGTGLSRDITGLLADVIHTVNDTAVPVLSVDLPSGLQAETGAVLGCAVRPTWTLSLATAKPVLFAGHGIVGEWAVADLGLRGLPVARLGDVVEMMDVAELWPTRASTSHKTRSGHLLVIAGCQSMAGAAVLTCRAALRSGVGLVTLLTPSSSLIRLVSLPPEVMVETCGDDSLGDVRTVDLTRYSAIAAGPGLGTLAESAMNGLRHLWRSSELPVVFDADALICAADAGPGQRVMTPHPGEASRMLGVSVSDLQADRFTSVRQLATTATALLKGPHTLVATPGQHIRVNPTGNAVLGTAGTGDVLTGVVGALLARGLSGQDAASAGAFVHGLAADGLRSRRAQGWTAGDVADAIPAAVASLQGEAC